MSPPTLRRQAGAGGLGSEVDDVLSRRRTISGPDSFPGNENDLLPREQVQQRPEPRPRSSVGPSASPDVTDGTATLRRKPRPLVTENDALASGAVTMTTSSDTLRRKPRVSEHTERAVQGNGQPDTGREARQNGGVVLRRRPVSEASDRAELGKDTCEWMEARKSLKPPVSPKPCTVNLRRTPADPPTPTRRVPIPGAEAVEKAQSPGETGSQLRHRRHLLEITAAEKLTDKSPVTKEQCNILCLNRTQAARSSSCVPKTPWTSYCPETS